MIGNLKRVHKVIESKEKGDRKVEQGSQSNLTGDSSMKVEQNIPTTLDRNTQNYWNVKMETDIL